MKSILVLFYSLLIGGHPIVSNAGMVNEKLLQSFKESFPNAEKVAWDVQPGIYIVHFMDDGVTTRIVYDKEGAFISSIRYYQERNLPYYLLNILKKKYAAKTIYSVTELASTAGIEYYVKLEDARVWLTVRMDGEGNLGVVEKYRKAA
jgi:hypothetical protein